MNCRTHCAQRGASDLGWGTTHYTVTIKKVAVTLATVTKVGLDFQL